MYTFHDWLSPDLAFFIGRPVRQLPSPRHLNVLPGREARFVLLQASEFENWPEEAPSLTLVTRLQGPRGEERILARTPGLLPVPARDARGPSPGRNAAAPLVAAE